MKSRLKVLVSAIIAFLCFVSIFTVTDIPNAVAESERRFNIVDEKSDGISFGGSWCTVMNGSFYGDQYHETSENGATVSYTFSGAYSISVVGAAASANSAAVLEIDLDGVKQSAAADSVASKKIWFAETTSGTHTITVTFNQTSDARFRFDGFFLEMDSIGVIQTLIDDDSSAFSYASFASLGDYHFTGLKGAVVTYSFQGLNFKSLELISERNIDSATISIKLNGQIVRENYELKSSSNLGESVIYTLTKTDINADPFEWNTVSITVKSESNSDLYFVFRGVKLTKFLSYEKEFDENDYVCTGGDPIETDVVVEKVYDNYYKLSGFVSEDGLIKSNTKGSSLEYRFVGTGVHITGQTGSDCGKAEVFIDEKYIGLVNFYNAETSDKVVFKINGLSQSMVHTIKVVVSDEKSYFSSGNFIRVNNLKIIKPSSDIQENDYDQFDYVLQAYTLKQTEQLNESTLEGVYGNWTPSTATIGGETKNIYSSGTKGSRLKADFSGTGIEIYGEKNTDKGKIQVYIDNVFMGLVNCYAPEKIEETVLFRANGLTQTVHNIRIIIAGECSAAATSNKVTVSNYKTISIKDYQDKSAIIDQNDSDVDTNFSTVTGKEYYNGTACFSNLDGYSLEYKFRGTAVSIYGNYTIDGGVGTVYIDGVLIGTFNTRAADEDSGPGKLLYVSPTLSEDENHSIKIVVESKHNPVLSLAYVTVDYFLVENYEKYIFPGYPSPTDEYTYTAPDFKYKTKQPSSDSIVLKEIPLGVFIGVLVGEAVVFAAAAFIIIMKKKKT